MALLNWLLSLSIIIFFVPIGLSLLFLSFTNESSRAGKALLVAGIAALLIPAFSYHYLNSTDENRRDVALGSREPSNGPVAEAQAAKADAIAKQAAAVKAVNCRKDLRCWAEENIAAASVYMKDPVSKQAKFASEWTDSWLDSKVSHYSWADKEQGLVRYSGDKIKFQNGFGAWSPMTYRFTFNPTTKEVSDIDIQEGRLD